MRRPPRRRRRALPGTLALCGAVLGALGATALHWYVITPGDPDLLAAADDVRLDGVRDVDVRVLGGAWAPSFDRAEVHWDAVADDEVTTESVAGSLRADGWSVVRVDRMPGGDDLRAERGQLYVSVNVVTGAGPRDVSITVGRGDVRPSLTVTAWTGTAVGAAAGAATGVLLSRRPAPAGSPARRRAPPGG